ncbi:MAG TPA: hypothetical protein DCS28_03470 [Candidatus Moranbacteria bacterium]|nr:hypothetical protein [Candidatus Moranbacteria bacterium]HAT75071.1 hypothetical protein [Candidatus Moranbacteria bacterium]
MNYSNKLKKIGFSEAEAAVYLACLELGGAKASEIAKKTNLLRTSIYTVSKALLEKSYLQKSKHGKIDKFIARDPKIILEETRENLDSFAAIVPNLGNLMNLAAKCPKVEFSETKEGILNIYKQIIKADRKYPICLIESGKAVEKIYEISGWDFVYEWQKKFSEKDIAVKGIITDDLLPVFEKIPEKIKNLLSRRTQIARVIKKEEFPFSINLYLMYPNLVYFIVPDSLFVLSIENKDIYISLKSMFEGLYEKTKSVDAKEIFG